MSKIDVNKVINGTPKKVLLNAFENLKTDYNESSASEYMSLYSNQPLSFIIENSEYIFSEPYCGLTFYESIVLNPKNCLFLKLQNEYDKVSSYINEHVNMPEYQKTLYQSLENKISTLLEHTKNTRIYANYINDHIMEGFEDKLSTAIYNNSDVSELFESADALILTTYLPYVMESVSNDTIKSSINKIYGAVNVDNDSIVEKWDDCTKAVICANKLSHDECYKEAVSNIENVNYRKILEYTETVDLEEFIEKVSTVVLKEEDAIFENPVNAINSLFDDIYEDLLFSESASAPEININSLKASVIKSAMDIMFEEYQSETDLEDVSTQYPYISEGSSIKDAYNIYMEMLSEMGETDYTEDVDDVSDEEIDSIDVDESEGTSGKKIKAPEPKNRAIEIQNKYMDKEAEQYRKRSMRMQKGQEKKNAIKAMANLPKNIAIDIQDQFRKIDKADDEKRKNFMTEPGFRKKWFRNLKLAILYGSAASVKLAFIPIIMTCRHFSKQKDVRIRNELVRELETEIKVTEEKINDASANGDQKEKYRLMRIRDQLNTEMVRVRLNSKYV